MHTIENIDLKLLYEGMKDVCIIRYFTLKIGWSILKMIKPII